MSGGSAEWWVLTIQLRVRWGRRLNRVAYTRYNSVGRTTICRYQLYAVYCSVAPACRLCRTGRGNEYRNELETSPDGRDSGASILYRLYRFVLQYPTGG